MRELKEEEMELVRGGSLHLTGLAPKLVPGSGLSAIVPDSVLKQEMRTLEQLKVHTLMDQWDVNS